MAKQKRPFVPSTDHGPATMEDARDGASKRGRSLEFIVRDIEKLTGAPISLNDARTVQRQTGRLSYGARAAIGLWFLVHDLQMEAQ